MKSNIFPIIVVCGFLAACGSEYGAGFCEQFPDDALCHDSTVQAGGNACQQAFMIASAAFDEACTGLGECCFCQCWNSGKLLPDAYDPCTCKSGTESGPCEGDALAEAEQCLADPTACRQALVDMVANQFCGF